MRRQQGEKKIFAVAPDTLGSSLEWLPEEAFRTTAPASPQQLDRNSSKLEPDPSYLARIWMYNEDYFRVLCPTMWGIQHQTRSSDHVQRCPMGQDWTHKISSCSEILLGHTVLYISILINRITLY
ncbi:hypothetical protein CEE35_05945 [Candidatus Aerophobetes bacterium Ae_b3b]|nr:MAG: hypothetical protein CEE35_05945 [Candidatus Aerophobetes bacterium Ae_b3b]